MREGKIKVNQSLKDASTAERLQGCLWVPNVDAPASCISPLLHLGDRLQPQPSSPRLHPMAKWDKISKRC